MPTDPPALAVPDPRAAILEDLRHQLGEVDQLTARLSKLEASVFSGTYAWVAATVAGQHAKSTREAIAQLAAELGRSAKCVESWCYCGKLMADRNLPPAEVDAASVRAVYTSARKLGKNALTRAVAMVREGRPLRDIKRHISRNTEYTEDDAKRAASRECNAGKVTEATVQARALHLAALAREVYGTRDVVVSVLVNDEQVAVAR